MSSFRPNPNLGRDVMASSEFGAALDKVAKAIATDAADRAPVGEEAPHLRDHIEGRVERDGTGFVGKVVAGEGLDEGLAPLVTEYGSVYVEAQPYLRPAAELYGRLESH